MNPLSLRTIRAVSRLAGFVPVLVAFCLTASSHADVRSGPADLVGQPAPLFTGKTLDGKIVSLEELRGRVVVLDFWATWCPYCVRAIPKVQAVAKRFEADPVAVLGVNLDKRAGAEEIAEFLRTNGITFPQLLDPQGFVKQKYLVRGIPSAVVIDKQGVVRNVHAGDTPDLVEQLGGHVAELLQND